MPTLITPRTRFFHVPKTGGTWAWKALIAGGVPIEELNRPSAKMIGWHAGLAETSDYEDRFTFAFVRHPLSWWRSFWGQRMRTGWRPEHEIDSLARSEDFAEFVEQVCERLPGHLGERFARYIGPPDRPIEFIGRYETLLDDLIRALRMAGERFDEGSLRAHPGENVGDYVRFPALYPRELAERLAESERATIERFYADEPMPERWLLPERRLRGLVRR